MRLIDKILIQSDFYIQHAGLGRRFHVRTASNFQDKLRATPHRFILDFSATKFCTEFVAAEAKTVINCLEVVRPPAERFWVEWMDRARIDVLASFAPVFKNRDQVPPGLRAGALIECAPGASRGVAWLFSESGEEANLCPLHVEFDLHGVMSAPLREDAYSSFSVRSAEFPALDLINEHALLTVEPSWREYVRSVSGSVQDFNLSIQSLAGKIIFDFPLIAAFLLLYQASGALHTTPSDFAQLNAIRKRRGKPELLEHVVVSTSLKRAIADGLVQARTSNGGAGGKRLHHVRGHMVRRAGAVFWRSPHLRGNISIGEIKSRTVNVKA